MIPHPPAIAPGWQYPISRLPYHFRFGTRHAQYGTVSEGQKKDCHKDCNTCTLIWGIIAATLGTQLVHFFVSMPPCPPCACDNLHIPRPADLHSGTYFAAECLALTAQPPRLKSPHYNAHNTSKAPNTNMRSPQLYALYKQATQDPPIDKAANPGTFDFKVSPATPFYNITSMAARRKADFLATIRAKPRSAPGRKSLTKALHLRRRRRSTSSWLRA